MLLNLNLARECGTGGAWLQHGPIPMAVFSLFPPADNCITERGLGALLAAVEGQQQQEGAGGQQGLRRVSLHVSWARGGAGGLLARQGPALFPASLPRGTVSPLPVRPSLGSRSCCSSGTPSPSLRRMRRSTAWSPDCYACLRLRTSAFLGLFFKKIKVVILRPRARNPPRTVTQQRWPRDGSSSNPRKKPRQSPALPEVDMETAGMGASLAQRRIQSARGDWSGGDQRWCRDRPSYGPKDGSKAQAVIGWNGDR